VTAVRDEPRAPLGIESELLRQDLDGAVGASFQSRAIHPAQCRRHWAGRRFHSRQVAMVISPVTRPPFAGAAIASGSAR